MPRANAYRQLRAKQSMAAEAESYAVPAPIGGLNARDSKAEMAETDAIVLDNWFPRPTHVEVRGGQTALATFSGNARTLCAYNGLTTAQKQLFAFIDNAGANGVYRVDNAAGGSPGSAKVSGLNSAVWDWEQFGTGAAEVLSLVNGVDPPMLYDGTTWYQLTSSSSPYALTGGPSPLSSLTMVTGYKSRLWYGQAGTFNVYYLGQNVFAGALTLLNIGPLFRLGGGLQMIVSCSVDNAAGLNDYIAFISTEGEVVMFQGYDPSSVSTWSEAGHFMIGAPLGFGRRGWQKLGSDCAVLCSDGIVPLSKALVTDRSQTQIALSDKIRDSFNQAAKLYTAAQTGWHFVLYSAGTKLVINVPSGGIGASTGAASFQYVQNTITGAWCTFNQLADQWGAQCFEIFENGLYMGTNGLVAQCDAPQAQDIAGPINCTAVPAFSYMGDKTKQKQWTACQLVMLCTGPFKATVTFNVDFNLGANASVIPLSNLPAAIWGSALWNVTGWGLAGQIAKPWFGLQGYGYAGSLGVAVSAGGGYQAQWQLSNYLLKPGTALYG